MRRNLYLPWIPYCPPWLMKCWWWMMDMMCLWTELDNAAARGSQVGSQGHGCATARHWCYYRRENQGNCLRISSCRRLSLSSSQFGAAFLTFFHDEQSSAVSLFCVISMRLNSPKLQKEKEREFAHHRKLEVGRYIENIVEISPISIYRYRIGDKWNIGNFSLFYYVFFDFLTLI